MKKIVLFGIGENGKKIVDVYLRQNTEFEILVIIDNFSTLNNYQGIPIAKAEEISQYEYDEIWISSSYYQDIQEQLTGELGISKSMVRHVEFAMPFLEQFLYNKYKDQIEGRKCCDTPELQNVIDYISENEVRMYNYPFYDEYQERDIPVFYDVEKSLYYGMYLGHKMYLSKKFNSVEKSKAYLRFAFMEQDKRSPHCYLAPDFHVDEGDVGVDIGAAEGIFALSFIDKASHIYLIESDPDWCEALAFTFHDYKDKVSIFNNFVSDSCENGMLTLDDLFREPDINFIKMDIEGAEMQALKGGEKLIRKCLPKLALCTYHHAEDGKLFQEWLSNVGNYVYCFSDGYVVCQGEWELEHPEQVDFRRALLFAKIK